MKIRAYIIEDSMSYKQMVLVNDMRYITSIFFTSMKFSGKFYDNFQLFYGDELIALISTKFLSAN